MTIQQTGEAWLPDAPHTLLCKYATIGSLDQRPRLGQLFRHLCVWVVKTHLRVWVGIPGWHAAERQPQHW